MKIIPFQKEFQKEVMALILSGLAEHWGEPDLTLNPDLNDIETSFSKGIFLTGWSHNTLAATGGALFIDQYTAQIVRMSVNKEFRKQGLGTQILDALVLSLKKMGIKRVILETTTTWTGVISFYRKYGFTLTHEHGEDSWFELSLF